MGNVLAPAAGLGSNSNYILFSNCKKLIDVFVTIVVTKDIALKSNGPPLKGEHSATGFSWQLNCYSSNKTVKGKPLYLCTEQQYVVALWNNQLIGAVNNWNRGSKLLFDIFNLTTLPKANVFPADYSIQFSLNHDSKGNVIEATYLIIDNYGNTLANIVKLLQLLPDFKSGDLAPIVAFELNLVGPAQGESALLSSGAGTINYTASSLLSVQNTVPPCADPGGTLETANSVYGALSATPANSFTQTFSVSGAGAQMVRKQEKNQHALIAPPHWLAS